MKKMKKNEKMMKKKDLNLITKVLKDVYMYLNIVSKIWLQNYLNKAKVHYFVFIVALKLLMEKMPTR